MIDQYAADYAAEQDAPGIDSLIQPHQIAEQARQLDKQPEWRRRAAIRVRDWGYIATWATTDTEPVL